MESLSHEMATRIAGEIIDQSLKFQSIERLLRQRFPLSNLPVLQQVESLIDSHDQLEERVRELEEMAESIERLIEWARGIEPPPPLIGAVIELPDDVINRLRTHRDYLDSLLKRARRAA